MSKKYVSAIITDLDNTLFDWVDIWYQSFNAMLHSLIQKSGISEEEIIPQIKQIHEKYRTSEYSMLIKELPCLKEKYPDKDLTKLFSSAINKYRKTRKKYLKLYPTVYETLEELKNIGCLIIGYTESSEFYTFYRIKKLKLDGIIDYIFSPPDHFFPYDKDEIRYYPPQHYKYDKTRQLYVSTDKLKPDPVVLNSIIDSLDIEKENVIYIGDSLMKDIYMAQKAEIIDVHAKYGVAQNREEYELLRKVTHWADEEVEREKKIEQKRQKSKSEINPSYTLHNTFGELLCLFKFIPFGFDMKAFNNKHTVIIDIWKKTVDVQQHFNDLELRIRNFAISTLGIILGIAGLTIKEAICIDFYGISIPIASLVTLLALMIWSAFYIMDRHWYHRLLYGSVKHGIYIEKRLKYLLPELGLATRIGDESHNRKFLWLRITTRQKMDLFYSLVAFGLIVLTFILLVSIKPKHTTANTMPQIVTQESLQ